MDKMTFLDVAEFVLKELQYPLSDKEIWSYAEKLMKQGIIDFETTGKTPWATMGARLYTDVKNYNSKFIGSGRPQKYMLKSLANSNSAPYENTDHVNITVENNSIDSFKERDMHKYLAFWNDQENTINTKTIFHEKSQKNKELRDHWLYPDMVGAKFNFSFQEEISNLANNLSFPLVKLYSYELKLDVTHSNVREYYFQAVSNSSWANPFSGKSLQRNIFLPCSNATAISIRVLGPI